MYADKIGNYIPGDKLSALCRRDSALKNAHD